MRASERALFGGFGTFMNATKEMFLKLKGVSIFVTVFS